MPSIGIVTASSWTIDDDGEDPERGRRDQPGQQDHRPEQGDLDRDAGRRRPSAAPWPPPGSAPRWSGRRRAPASSGCGDPMPIASVRARGSRARGCRRRPPRQGSARRRRRRRRSPSPEPIVTPLRIRTPIPTKTLSPISTGAIFCLTAVAPVGMARSWKSLSKISMWAPNSPSRPIRMPAPSLLIIRLLLNSVRSPISIRALVADLDVAVAAVELRARPSSRTGPPRRGRSRRGRRTAPAAGSCGSPRTRRQVESTRYLQIRGPWARPPGRAHEAAPELRVMDGGHRRTRHRRLVRRRSRGAGRGPAGSRSRLEEPSRREQRLRSVASGWPTRPSPARPLLRALDPHRAASGAC